MPESIDRAVCIILEFNCHENAERGDDTPASVWLVPYSLSADEHDLDYHKPRSTRIIGPVALGVAEQVGDALSVALSHLGFTIERETTADD